MVYTAAVVTLYATAEFWYEVVICTTNKKYVTNNPSSYKPTVSVGISLDPTSIRSIIVKHWHRRL